MQLLTLLVTLTTAAVSAGIAASQSDLSALSALEAVDTLVAAQGQNLLQQLQQLRAQPLLEGRGLYPPAYANTSPSPSPPTYATLGARRRALLKRESVAPFSGPADYYDTFGEDYPANELLLPGGQLPPMYQIVTQVTEVFEAVQPPARSFHPTGHPTKGHSASAPALPSYPGGLYAATPLPGLAPAYPTVVVDYDYYDGEEAGNVLGIILPSPQDWVAQEGLPTPVHQGPPKEATHASAPHDGHAPPPHGVHKTPSPPHSASKAPPAHGHKAPPPPRPPHGGSGGRRALMMRAAFSSDEAQ